AANKLAASAALNIVKRSPARQLTQAARGCRRVVTTFALHWKQSYPEWQMATAQCNDKACRDELERVLSSTFFARSERMSKLLRFLVERQLEGRESELKESIIGIEVFGRRPDYNPKRDSTVRTEAVRVRARLKEYYSNIESQDRLVI